MQYFGILLLALSHFVNAQSSEPEYYCDTMYTKGQCANIIEDPIDKMIECSNSGDLESQMALAQIYHHGLRGEKKDPDKAFQWALASAKQSCPDSQLLLGYLHYYGQGVPKNLKKAIEWWDEAALNGHPTALCQVGLQHLMRQITHYDLAKGFEYAKASYNDSSHCAAPLAYAYYKGLGTNKDIEKSKTILHKAMNAGDKEAQQLYERFFKDK